MPILGDFAAKYAARSKDLGVNIGDLYEALVRTGEDTVRAPRFHSDSLPEESPSSPLIGIQACTLIQHLPLLLTISSSGKTEYCMEDVWIPSYRLDRPNRLHWSANKRS